jgi:hypothetical protein
VVLYLVGVFRLRSKWQMVRREEKVGEAGEMGEN